MKTRILPRSTRLAVALAALALAACERSGEEDFFRVADDAPPEAVTDVDPPRSGQRTAPAPATEPVTKAAPVVVDAGDDAPGRKAAIRYMSGQEDTGAKLRPRPAEVAELPRRAPAGAEGSRAPVAATTAPAAAPRRSEMASIPSERVPDAASRAAEPAIAARIQDPGNARALNRRAIALINSSQPGPAVPLLERALAMQPRDAEILGNLGYAYMLTGEHAKARSRLLGSLELAPTRSATWLNLGQTYAEMGQRDVAVDAVLKGYRYSTRKPSVRSALQRAARGPRYDPGWREAAGIALQRIGEDGRS